MSEKTKPDQQASSPEREPPEPTEQVPDWLAGKLRRLNDQIVGEQLPDDLLALLQQLHNKESNR